MSKPFSAKDAPLELLIIENNPADSRLILEAFKEIGITDNVHCLRDGVEALAFLRQEGDHAGAPRPHLMFLDLDMPKKPGLQVLAEIKSNPRIKTMPVVVVSGSNNPAEIREAYELHASCFISKPGDLHQFFRFIQTCYSFWSTVVTLPPEC